MNACNQTLYLKLQSTYTRTNNQEITIIETIVIYTKTKHSHFNVKLNLCVITIIMYNNKIYNVTNKNVYYKLPQWTTHKVCEIHQGSRKGYTRW